MYKRQGLSGQAKEFQEWMTPKSKEMMVDYSSNYDIEVNAKMCIRDRISYLYLFSIVIIQFVKIHFSIDVMVDYALIT